jgi:hypothetical protein
MPIYPISFSIPSSKIRKTVPEKTQNMASLIPGDLSTYIFTDEKSYYEDYAKSVFGKTWKKGGWDCMRHYEILANGCIPWFEGLNDCPENTMTHFPKKLVKEAMVSNEPETFIPALLDHTRKYCTTKAMAQYVLDKIGHSSAKRVLYLSEQPVPDYLREMLLIGFKEILGKGCVESILLPYIYDDYQDTTKLYGRGFSYTKNIPVDMKPDLIHVDDIKNHTFDLVIYGSMHRGMPYFDLVNKHYAPSDIVLVCGEDICNDSNSLGERGYNVFIREL